jgi:hypothetical protein
MLAVKNTQPMGLMPKRPLVKGYQVEGSENNHLEAFLRPHTAGNIRRRAR